MMEQESSQASVGGFYKQSNNSSTQGLLQKAKTIVVEGGDDSMKLNGTSMDVTGSEELESSAESGN